MKEEILDKSDNFDSLKNNKSLIKTKISSIIASLTFIGLITYIILLIFNNRNIMNFSSNSINKIINKENDINYSFTEEDDKTIEIINPNFKNIISKLKIDGEEVETCTSYNFKSKGIHKIYYTLNLEGVTSFEQMFYRNKYLTSISFSPSFNMENITNVERWLQFCDNLLSLDLSHLNFGKIRSLRHAFSL